MVDRRRIFPGAIVKGGDRVYIYDVAGANGATVNYSGGYAYILAPVYVSVPPDSGKVYKTKGPFGMSEWSFYESSPQKFAVFMNAPIATEPLNRNTKSNKNWGRRTTPKLSRS